jgi:hypothetical protein
LISLRVEKICFYGQKYIIPLKRLLANFLIKSNKTLEIFFVKLKNLLAFLSIKAAKALI